MSHFYKKMIGINFAYLSFSKKYPILYYMSKDDKNILKRPEADLKDLSKSKLKNHLTCKTLFYLDEYHKELKEETDTTTQQTFDTGRIVETHARTQFCLSIPLFKNITDKNSQLVSPLSKILSQQVKDLESIKNILGKDLVQFAQEIEQAMSFVVEVIDKANIDKRNSTEKYLNEGKRIIFEAAFKGSGLTHVQADILYVNDDGSFDAHEIKSGGGKKMEEYEFDTATQLLVMKRQSQYKINKIYLWHINTQSNDVNNIFTILDMTEVAEKMKDKVLSEEQLARETQFMTEAPKPVYDSKCASCPFFKKSCGKHFIDNPKAIMYLPGFRAKWAMMNNNQFEVSEEFLKSIPEDLVKTKDKDEFLKKNPQVNYGLKNPNIIKSLLENKRYINISGLKEELSQWKFPLRFFDFEAYMDAFPLFVETRPYEAVVTQFSCHTLTNPKAELIHADWFHETCANPKKETVIQLLKAVGDDEGSIVSYNKTYETTRIKELIKLFPEYTDQLNKVLERFVDLMEVIESYVFDPQFFGSYSLKVVSPVLLNIENGCYNDVDLKSGSAYTPTYKKMMFSQDEKEKQYLISDMKKYCYYDTLNLYLIYSWLLKQIEESNEK